MQLAHWRGPRVTGTASARSASDLQAEGADEVIDYRTTRFEDVVRDADVVLDTIGGDTLARSWGVLKRGGTLVSLVATPSQEATAHGVRGVTFIVEPNRAELIEIGRLVDAHVVRSIVEAVLPLAHAREAYARGLRRVRLSGGGVAGPAGLARHSLCHSRTGGLILH